MFDIFLFSLVAAANANLLAAVTVMLFLPEPKRLLLGYLAGAPYQPDDRLPDRLRRPRR